MPEIHHSIFAASINNQLQTKHQLPTSPTSSIQTTQYTQNNNNTHISKTTTGQSNPSINNHNSIIINTITDKGGRGRGEEELGLAEGSGTAGQGDGSQGIKEEEQEELGK